MFGEDYNPPELMYIVGGGLGVHVGSFSSIPEIENEEAWLVNRVPALAWDRGDDIDGAWFKVVARTRSGMRWENLFPSFLGRITPQQYTAECSCLDILNYLCFFDALSPLSVGPDRGPIFKEPVPMEKWSFYIGFLR